MSNAQELKSQFTYNRKQVLFLTAITEQEYENFRIDTARAWVERFFRNIDVDALMSNCSLFWKWWNYNWNTLDDNGIVEQLYGYSAGSRYVAYRQMHQMVFEANSTETEQLISDFKSMRYDFEVEMKNKAVNEG